jgi:hypothetical protein
VEVRRLQQLARVDAALVMRDEVAVELRRRGLGGEPDDAAVEPDAAREARGGEAAERGVEELDRAREGRRARGR